MDTGISASGALDVDGSPEKILGCLAKLALDGACIRLFLPAAVFGSVVLQGKSPGFQDPSLARSATDECYDERHESVRPGRSHVQRI
jgi:hypothetical protein